MLKQIFNIIIRGSDGANQKPSLDKLLEQADQHLNNFKTLIPPAPESKPRTQFDADVPRDEMTIANFTPKQKLKVMTRALPLILNMKRSTSMYNGKFRPKKRKPHQSLLQNWKP